MDVTALYKDVEKFNAIAGNLKNVDAKSVDNQVSFIFEELTETITAVEEGNVAELIDGAADLFVTVAGLMQKLYAAGFNVEEAIKRVNANNLSKFPLTSDPRLLGVKSIVPKEAVSVVANEEHGVYVFKNINGKIIKPTNFKAVDLSDLVVQDFLVEA